jgi:hypothetical protein
VVESKFTKSLSNQGTQKAGLSLLLSDRRFQVPNIQTKRRILELVGKSESFGTQTFDAIMTPEPSPPISLANVDGYFADLRFIEMKTTKKPIQDEALRGFFFGATEREYEMARILGPRYLLAFVILNSLNSYNRPFAVLLTLNEVQRRTRARRVQYQVNLKTDTVITSDDGWLLLFGEASDIPS